MTSQELHFHSEPVANAMAAAAEAGTAAAAVDAQFGDIAHAAATRSWPPIWATAKAAAAPVPSSASAAAVGFKERESPASSLPSSWATPSPSPEAAAAAAAAPAPAPAPALAPAAALAPTLTPSVRPPQQRQRPADFSSIVEAAMAAAIACNEKGKIEEEKASIEKERKAEALKAQRKERQRRLRLRQRLEREERRRPRAIAPMPPSPPPPRHQQQRPPAPQPRPFPPLLLPLPSAEPATSAAAASAGPPERLAPPSFIPPDFIKKWMRSQGMTGTAAGTAVGGCTAPVVPLALGSTTPPRAEFHHRPFAAAVPAVSTASSAAPASCPTPGPPSASPSSPHPTPALPPPSLPPDTPVAITTGSSAESQPRTIPQGSQEPLPPPTAPPPGADTSPGPSDPAPTNPASPLAAASPIPPAPATAATASAAAVQAGSGALGAEEAAAAPSPVPAPPPASDTSYAAAAAAAAAAHHNNGLLSSPVPIGTQVAGCSWLQQLPLAAAAAATIAGGAAGAAAGTSKPSMGLFGPVSSSSPSPLPSPPSNHQCGAAPPQPQRATQLQLQLQLQQQLQQLRLRQHLLPRLQPQWPEQQGQQKKRRRVLPPRCKVPWTAEEDEMLEEAVRRFPGRQWKKIATFLPGRTSVQCCHHYQQVLDPNVERGPWTRDEDETVLRLVAAVGKKWSVVAKMMPRRLGKKIRERYLNHLDPSLKKGGWTKDEEQILVEKHAQFGSKWTRIASFLPGRGMDSIRRHWAAVSRGSGGGGPSDDGSADRTGDVVGRMGERKGGGKEEEEEEEEEEEAEEEEEVQGVDNGNGGGEVEGNDDESAAEAILREQVVFPLGPAPPPLQQQQQEIGQKNCGAPAAVAENSPDAFGAAAGANLFLATASPEQAPSALMVPAPQTSGGDGAVGVGDASAGGPGVGDRAGDAASGDDGGGDRRRREGAVAGARDKEPSPEERRPPPPAPAPAPPTRWTAEQSLRLKTLVEGRQLVTRSGANDWTNIAKQIPAKTDLQCMLHWNHVMDPHLAKGKGSWTPEEDRRVLELVREHGQKWSVVATRLSAEMTNKAIDTAAGAATSGSMQRKSRVGKQIRDRYLHHLDPNLKKGEWTPDEERILAREHAIHNNRWAKIAKSLLGRCDNDIKNHWHANQRRLMDRAQEQTSPPDPFSKLSSPAEAPPLPHHNHQQEQERQQGQERQRQPTGVELGTGDHQNCLGRGMDVLGSLFQQNAEDHEPRRRSNSGGGKREDIGDRSDVTTMMMTSAPLPAAAASAVAAEAGTVAEAARATAGEELELRATAGEELELADAFPLPVAKRRRTGGAGDCEGGANIGVGIGGVELVGSESGVEEAAGRFDDGVIGVGVVDHFGPADLGGGGGGGSDGGGPVEGAADSEFQSLAQEGEEVASGGRPHWW